MVSLFSNPDRTLLRQSMNTLGVVNYFGEAGLTVIDIKTILSVVAMIPYRLALTAEERTEPAVIQRAANRFFVGEKPGLDVASFGERAEADLEGQ